MACDMHFAAPFLYLRSMREGHSTSSNHRTGSGINEASTGMLCQYQAEYPDDGHNDQKTDGEALLSIRFLDSATWQGTCFVPLYFTKTGTGLFTLDPFPS
jgi:hypothetical protein